MTSSEAPRATKLFIGGLTRDTSTKLLREHFARYGRVLDCVAMVQPNGRPRGFGYVTLDSPSAAERCLAEPQLIDGRHIEMKRAVPGPTTVAAVYGSGRSGRGGQRSPVAANQGRSPSHAGSPIFPPGAWDMQTSPTASQLMAAQAAMAAQASAAWAAAWAATSPGGAADLDGLGFTGDASCRSFGSYGEPFPGFGMSPSSTPTVAATPLGASRLFGAYDLGTVASGRHGEEAYLNGSDDDDTTPPKTAAPAALSSRPRTILGDITNLSSPVKIKLPSAMSSCFGKAALGGQIASDFRAQRPSALDIYGEDDEAEGVERLVYSGKENATPSNFSFPPGLSQPMHKRAATPLGALSTPAPRAALPR